MCSFLQGRQVKAIEFLFSFAFRQKNPPPGLHALRASKVTNGVGGGAIIEGSYGVYMNTESILGRQW